MNRGGDLANDPNDPDREPDREGMSIAGRVDGDALSDPELSRDSGMSTAELGPVDRLLEVDTLRLAVGVGG